MLKKRKLGKQGLEVSELGLGLMGMSQSYGTRNDPESIATIHRALELGVTFFDTAEVYGVGHNEELLGRALEGRRDQASSPPSSASASKRERSPASTAAQSTSAKSWMPRCDGSAPTASTSSTSTASTSRSRSRRWSAR